MTKLPWSQHATLVRYFSFSAATSAFGFIATIILVRLILPSEFGRIALFLSIQFFFVPLTGFAADNLIAINHANLTKPDYEYFRRSYVTLAYSMFVAIQSAFLIVFALGWLADPLLLLIPLTSLVRYLVGIASIEYVMEEKSVKYGAMQLYTAVLSLMFTLLFVYTIADTADSRIAALLIADIVFLVVRYKNRAHLLLSPVFDKRQFISIQRFGFPLLISVVPAWALNEADKVILANQVDLTAAGYYASACAIAGFMITFNAALMNATLPRLYLALRNESVAGLVPLVKRFMFRHLLFSAIFAACFLSVYSFLADYILPYKYKSAQDIVYWIVLFGLARSFYAIIGAVTDYFGMTVEKLKSITLGAIVALSAIFVGISLLGPVGAAIGVGAGYTVLGSALWWHLLRRMSNNDIWHKIEKHPL